VFTKWIGPGVDIHRTQSTQNNPGDRINTIIYVLQGSPGVAAFIMLEPYTW
jgi:hypothetical protein